MRSNAQSLKEYGRGIIGGLIFSLPIVCTMEMWWAGFILPPEKLLVNVLVTFLLLVGYNSFSGLRKDNSFWEVCRESVEEIGLAFVATFLFLLLIDRVEWSMSFYEIAGKTIVETMVVAIGISVGTEQLVADEENGSDASESSSSAGTPEEREFIRMIVLSVCGAVLFIAPVASTVEILIMAIESSFFQQIGMVIVSIVLAFITLFFSDFKGTMNGETNLMKMISHLVTLYLIVLLVAGIFLWFYDNLSGYNLHVILGKMIILGIPGTLGASAGRLLLGSNQQ